MKEKLNIIVYTRVLLILDWIACLISISVIALSTFIHAGKEYAILQGGALISAIIILMALITWYAIKRNNIFVASIPICLIFPPLIIAVVIFFFVDKRKNVSTDVLLNDTKN